MHSNPVLEQIDDCCRILCHPSSHFVFLENIVDVKSRLAPLRSTAPSDIPLGIDNVIPAMSRKLWLMQHNSKK